jgi:riboflavin synthase
MTVTEWDSEKYSFFVMQESLNVTNFQYKKDGEYFNIERCVKVGDRIDGHIVSGHIDTI